MPAAATGKASPDGAAEALLQGGTLGPSEGDTANEEAEAGLGLGATGGARRRGDSEDLSLDFDGSGARGPSEGGLSALAAAEASRTRGSAVSRSRPSRATRAPGGGEGGGGSTASAVAPPAGGTATDGGGGGSLPDLGLSAHGAVLRGISDEELAGCAAELEGMLSGAVAKPAGMRALGSGAMGRGGRWLLEGAEDEATGLLNLYLEGHFAVPLDVMERCVLDERLQLSYDSFMKFKNVLGLAGDGGEAVPWTTDPESGAGPGPAAPLGRTSRSEVVHHEMAYPFPLSNRDYVYYRRRTTFPVEPGGRGYAYVQRDVETKAVGTALAPPGRGVIRAGNGLYWQLGMGRTEPETDPGGVGRCVVVVRSQDNCEGRIPKWLQNFAAKKGAPGYVKQLEKAALQLMVREGRITAAEAKAKWK